MKSNFEKRAISKSSAVWRLRPKMPIIDLDVFREYLDYLYIKKVSEQNKIIRSYVNGCECFKRISYIETILEELGYPDETINNILLYIVNTGRREYINKHFLNKE